MAKDPKDQLTELVKLVKDYARQETVGPLKTLGRYIGFGVAGALLMAVGLVFLVLGGLRYAQTHKLVGQQLTDGWSWLPYVLFAVVALFIAGLFAWRINKEDDHG